MRADRFFVCKKSGEAARPVVSNEHHRRAGFEGDRATHHAGSSAAHDAQPLDDKALLRVGLVCKGE